MRNVQFSLHLPSWSFGSSSLDIVRKKMERLAALLEPHAKVLSQIATTTSFIRLVSPIYMLGAIRKKKSSAGFPFLPFTGGLVLTIVNVKLATITANDALLKSNLAGLGLHVIYSFVYYLYTPEEDRSKLRHQIVLTGLVALLGVAYCQYEDPKKVDLRMGLILKAWLMLLIGAPFLGLRRIIRNKSVGSMPLPMVSSGAMMSFSWMLYGLATRKKFVFIPNLILFSMGSILLCLYAIYPPKSIHPKTVKEKKDK